MMGKGGQMSSDVLVGVVSEQTTRRSSRRGDVKTRFRHFRHTCVSVFHLHLSLELLTIMDAGFPL